MSFSIYTEENIVISSNERTNRNFNYPGFLGATGGATGGSMGHVFGANSTAGLPAALAAGAAGAGGALDSSSWRSR